MPDREQTVREIDGTIIDIESYGITNDKQELYHLLEEGIKAGKEGRVRPYREVIAEIRKKINK